MSRRVVRQDQYRRLTTLHEVSRHREHEAWFVGALVLMVYLIFAMTLYLLPPAAQ
jgi:hypothetical protein